MTTRACACGRTVECRGFTNTCACGRDYNWAGQLLTPRCQWGEETGETAEEILQVDADLAAGRNPLDDEEEE